MDTFDESDFQIRCKISTTQQHYLQTCSPALVHELLSDEDDVINVVGEVDPTVGTPVESTGIIMLSLPDTKIDDDQQDLFQTPPEDLYKDCDLGFSQSQTLGFSQDRAKDPVVADGLDTGETLSIDDLEGEKVVDLSKDCALGLTQSQTLCRSEDHAKNPVAADRVDDGETFSVDDLEAEELGNLGNDSDPGSLIGKLISAIELQETVAGERNVELDKSCTGKEDELKEAIVEDSVSEGVDLVSGNDPTESQIQVDPAKNLDVNGIVSSSGVNRDKRKRKRKSSGREKNVELEKSCTETNASEIQVDTAKKLGVNGVTSSSSINRDKRQQKKNSHAGNLSKKGRELPASIIGGPDNVKESEIPAHFMMMMKSFADKSGPIDDNGDDCKGNFVEITMSRGVKFSRPRWWPPGYQPKWCPEGYEWS